MGAFHLSKFIRLPDADVVGLFDPSEARAAAIARDYNVKAHARLADLLFASEAVVIAAPTASHYSLCKQALDAGLHVLVEKPICDTVEPAEELVSLAKARGLVLQTGLLERYRLRALLDVMPAFSPDRFECLRASPSVPRGETADVIADLMIHDLDLLVATIDRDAVDCVAEGKVTTGPGWDHVRASIAFASGRTAVVEADRSAPERKRWLRLMGKDLTANLDFLTDEISWSASLVGSPIQRRKLSSIDALDLQARDFLRCVREGARPLVSAEQALQSLRLSERVRESIGVVAKRERLGGEVLSVPRE